MTVHRRESDGRIDNIENTLGQLQVDVHKQSQIAVELDTKMEFCISERAKVIESIARIDERQDETETKLVLHAAVQEGTNNQLVREIHSMAESIEEFSHTQANIFKVAFGSLITLVGMMATAMIWLISNSDLIANLIAHISSTAP